MNIKVKAGLLLLKDILVYISLAVLFMSAAIYIPQRIIDFIDGDSQTRANIFFEAMWIVYAVIFFFVARFVVKILKEAYNNKLQILQTQDELKRE